MELQIKITGVFFLNVLMSTVSQKVQLLEFLPSRPELGRSSGMCAGEMFHVKPTKRATTQIFIKPTQISQQKTGKKAKRNLYVLIHKIQTLYTMRQNGFL